MLYYYIIMNLMIKLININFIIINQLININFIIINQHIIYSPHLVNSPVIIHLLYNCFAYLVYHLILNRCQIYFKNSINLLLLLIYKN
jgi:hypothetical protein